MRISKVVLGFVVAVAALALFLFSAALSGRGAGT